MLPTTACCGCRRGSAGFSGFLQFCKAVRPRGVVELEWDDAADDCVLRVPAR